MYSINQNIVLEGTDSKRSKNVLVLLKVGFMLFIYFCCIFHKLTCFLETRDLGQGNLPLSISETLAETIESGPILIYNYFLINFLILLLALYNVTFQCGCKNIFRNFLKISFAHKKLKKPPEEVAYLWQLRVFFL